MTIGPFETEEMAREIAIDTANRTGKTTFYAMDAWDEWFVLDEDDDTDLFWVTYEVTPFAKTA